MTPGAFGPGDRYGCDGCTALGALLGPADTLGGRMPGSAWQQDMVGLPLYVKEIP